MARVFVVGSFNVDHGWRVASLPQAGATLSGEYATGPGGKGFNQAMAARRAGAATRFACALGEDASAQLARALCTADGIDLHDARADALPLELQPQREAAAVGMLVVLRQHQQRAGRQAHAPAMRHALRHVAAVDRQLVRGQVLAGPANDQVETGDHVRTIGYDPRHRVAD